MRQSKIAHANAHSSATQFINPTKNRFILFTLVCSLMTLVGCAEKQDSASTDPQAKASGGFSVSPTTITIGTNSNYTFVASGGTAPYYYYISTGEGSIGRTTGVFYSTGNSGTTKIQVMDSNSSVVYAIVTVSNSTSSTTVSFTQGSSISLTVNSAYSFTATGGTTPYKFYMNSSTGGSIDINSGYYIAPSYTTTEQIRVVDANNQVAYLNIAVNSSTTSTTGTWISLYRLYNFSTQDSLYSTVSTEGTGNGYGLQATFKLLSTSGISGTAAVYRCRTTTIPQHHYLSLSSSCDGKIIDSPANGSSYMVGYVYTSNQTGLVALYRFVSGGQDYIFTTDSTTPSGYSSSGILGYVSP